LAADPSAGVWLYTPPVHDPQRSLQHLVVEGTPPAAKVVEAEDSPRLPDMPGVAYPHLAVARDGRIAIVGQTLEGDCLVEVAEGDFVSHIIPPEVLHGRHVTVLEFGPTGLLYAGTDGAGLLTYDGAAWAVHAVTAYLPALPASDLKPVDDVLVGDDGTVYVASQRYAAIWKP